MGVIGGETFDRLAHVGGGDIFSLAKSSGEDEDLFQKPERICLAVTLVNNLGISVGQASKCYSLATFLILFNRLLLR